MREDELYRRILEAVDQGGEDGHVDVGISAEKRIITLTGHVCSRRIQIAIEDAVERLVSGFTIVNMVKVDPCPGRPLPTLH